MKRKSGLPDPVFSRKQGCALNQKRMIIYNVTMNVQEEVVQEWVDWMRTVHIPAMLATGKFTKALMCRVNVEEPMGGITYSVQYTAPNKASLQAYYREHAYELRKESKLFEGKFVAFRTELEIMDEQYAE